MLLTRHQPLQTKSPVFLSGMPKTGFAVATRGEGSNSEAAQNRPSFLACPFYKLEPNVYSQCSFVKFRSTADVRQHVLRSPMHREPLHCPRCKHVFGRHNDRESSRSLDDHIRQGGCDRHDIEVSGISEHQIMQLRDSPGRPVSITEGWFYIWDILFPDVVRPNSPYFTLMDIKASEMQAPLNGHVSEQSPEPAELLFRYELPAEPLQACESSGEFVALHHEKPPTDSAYGSVPHKNDSMNLTPFPAPLACQNIQDGTLTD
ncbi:hypothetical protein EDB80DRAFT_117860 [Ilyonectria destructans]|nr:hypothetical protein EDB80DRAFT_117860 [Ilyonectria destructans]